MQFRLVSHTGTSCESATTVWFDELADTSMAYDRMLLVTVNLTVEEPLTGMDTSEMAEIVGASTVGQIAVTASGRYTPALVGLLTVQVTACGAD